MFHNKYYDVNDTTTTIIHAEPKCLCSKRKHQRYADVTNEGWYLCYSPADTEPLSNSNTINIFPLLQKQTTHQTSKRVSIINFHANNRYTTHIVALRCRLWSFAARCGVAGLFCRDMLHWAFPENDPCCVWGPSEFTDVELCWVEKVAFAKRLSFKVGDVSPRLIL